MQSPNAPPQPQEGASRQHATMLVGMKAAGWRLGRSHLLRLMVSGPRSHQISIQGTWGERLKPCPRNGGRCTDDHRDFPFPSWEEFSAETQMGLKSCEPNSSKQFSEARSYSFRFRFRHLVTLCPSVVHHKNMSGDPHNFLTLITEQVGLLPWTFKRKAKFSF